MIKPYQKINIDNLDRISEDCFDIISEAGIPKSTDLYYLDIEQPDRFKNNELLKSLMLDLKLYDYWFCTAVVVSYDDMPIHTDAGSFHYSFNIPIRNTKKTYTMFYETSDQPVQQQVQDGSAYNFFKFDSNTIKMIDKIEMLQPAIINTQIPHNVIHFSSDLPRITILLRLNLSFDPNDFNWT